MNADLASKKEIFRKYDIRGIYPDELDEELTGAVTRALAEKLFKEGKVVIGHDPRKSSESLRQAVVGALADFEDIEVVEVGLITTPMLYFLVNELKASGGIMITASHNPKEYNGLKVVGKEAAFIGGDEVLRLMQ